MRKLIYTALIATLTLSFNAVHAQEQKLEKRFEAGIHLLGVGVNYEYPIVDQLTVLGKVQYNVGFFGNSDYVDYIASLSLGVESRYYYNFNKRVRKGKNTKNNSANFLSLGFDYMPDALTNTDSKDNIKVEKSSHLSPMWNIRRNIGQSNFSYEAGIGIDFYRIHYDHRPTEKETGLALRLSIGYTF
ncbi:hypothetical protein VSP10_06015 [Myroides odoratimimus]|uniref:Outer membrane protein beta-barrel domain-containing protein n=1 Tax=Myroides odoratimimus CIP 101113 TaxID=883154 RepID=A0AAV3F7R1_9FLAO|nr:hypothetical protein [Myroides odoratimimus]EHO15071.1 hypothetical protein HMPREF9715_00259 [Myroides odoratimimus CIP 101113]EKB04500.1 hypothetical protein HMPREF9711_01829 [Myroides odoratimimus CCUG 3837]EPH10756.1 hypothetical protein HMPREF9713_02320 [Myroides odoratimimus CCUG 12700]MEC4052342.1 hypothetical protein [Myroides odoratimimus]SHK93134.1 hypothetical protein SAMN05444275_101260 [Myroides odoratimimus subsp. xuanwuensis]